MAFWDNLPFSRVHGEAMEGKKEMQMPVTSGKKSFINKDIH